MNQQKRVQFDFEIVLGCLVDLFLRAQIVAHYFTGGSRRVNGAGKGVARHVHRIEAYANDLKIGKKT